MADQYLNVPMPQPFAEGAEPGELGAAAPVVHLPVMKNFADNMGPFLTAQVRDLCDVTAYARLQRRPLEDEWNAIAKMESMQHDNGRRYMGNSNSYIPLFARIIQTKVSTLGRGLFPTDDFFNVLDNGGDEAKAAATKAYLKWELNKNAQIKRQVKPMLRQLGKYGNSVWKIWYEKQPPKFKTGRMAKKDGVLTASFVTPGSKQGLRLSPRNLLYFYMWPTSAASVDEATVVFEDVAVSRLYARAKMTSGEWKGGDAAMRAAPSPSYLTNQMDQHTTQNGISTPSASPIANSDLGGQVVLTECYTFMVLPPEAYVDGEDPNEAIPTLVILAGSVPVVVTRNPFFHQKSPFLMGRTNSDPGLIYGYGDGRTTRPLQYLTNDFANQTVDVGSYALNPVIKMNPGLLAGPLRPLKPGVVWAMTDVQNGAVFDRPPTDLIQYGQAMLNMWSSMGMDLSGAPPVLQGTGGGKGAKTATGAQILQRNAMAPLQDMVEDLEQDMLVPVLRMGWMLAQQYRDDNIKLAVAGGKLEVTPEDLLIDAEFEWLASSQAQNQAQRTQQSIAFLQALMPWVPILAQQGKTIDPVPLLKKVYTEGFGFRGFDDLIKQAMQGAMPPGPGMPPGALPSGQVAPEQANLAAQDSMERIRSAMDNVLGEGGGGDMAAGEGEDFMDIRNQGNDLSSALGSTYGQGEM